MEGRTKKNQEDIYPARRKGSVTACTDTLVKSRAFTRDE